MKSLIIICLLFALLACKKDETKINFSLPPITQEGKNTFGFLLNEQAWVNYGRICFGLGCDDETLKGGYNSNGTLRINASRYLKKKGEIATEEYFDIELKNYKQIGTYLIDGTSQEEYIRFVRVDRKNNSRKTYLVDSTKNSGTLVVTQLDTVAMILSGTFEANLYNESNQADAFKISQGRFDILLKR